MVIANTVMPCYMLFLDILIPDTTYEFLRLICSTVYPGIPDYENYTKASIGRENN
jgi:hypothetical protein